MRARWEAKWQRFPRNREVDGSSPLASGENKKAHGLGLTIKRVSNNSEFTCPKNQFNQASPQDRVRRMLHDFPASPCVLNMTSIDENV
jgi:hypothetical protein